MEDHFKDYVEICALCVEADGMKAENLSRKLLNQSPAYSEESFFKIADKIRSLGEKHSKTSPQSSIISEEGITDGLDSLEPAQVSKKGVISFREQFIKCSESDSYREKIVPLTPDLLPICPDKARKMDGSESITLLECLRFGGICRSSNPGCEKYRKGLA